MRYGLAILTYVPRGGPPGLRHRLPTALASLEQTNYSGPLIIVDDGSTDEVYLGYLSDLSRSIAVVRRSKNGGIALAKNTCLKALQRLDVDVGFIAEDDILFRTGWLHQYLTAHRTTRIHHFSWAWDQDPSGDMKKAVQEIAGYPIVGTSRVNGVFLTFTRTVLETVGGFKVMPAVWGHEHTNWTRRIIAAGLAPEFVDILNSNRYVTLNSFSANSSVKEKDRELYASQNQSAAEDLFPIFHPILE